jgi:hypothetical protein
LCSPIISEICLLLDSVAFDWTEILAIMFETVSKLRQIDNHCFKPSIL